MGPSQQYDLTPLLVTGYVVVLVGGCGLLGAWLRARGRTTFSRWSLCELLAVIGTASVGAALWSIFRNAGGAILVLTFFVLAYVVAGSVMSILMMRHFTRSDLLNPRRAALAAIIGLVAGLLVFCGVSVVALQREQRTPSWTRGEFVLRRELDIWTLAGVELYGSEFFGIVPVSHRYDSPRSGTNQFHEVRWLGKGVTKDERPFGIEMAEMSNDDASEFVVRSKLQSDDAGERLWAVTTLFIIPRERRESAARPMLDDPDPRVVAAAVRFLERLKRQREGVEH